MNTNLATIQKVTDIQPILNANAIEVATVMGWKCVVKKGEFKVGDLGVYISIDTIVPEIPVFEFMRKVHFRIRTIRLRKQLSQGLLLPLSSFATLTNCIEGQDVTEAVGVKKYEKPVPENMRGQIKGSFPSCVSRTDEIMIQSILPVLDEIQGKEVYITVKCDGTSATFIHNNGEVDVCSRNVALKETENNVYWKMYRKYADKMEDGFAVQGEVVGEGIQKNRLGLKGHDFLVFNVYNIKSGKYLDYQEMLAFCNKYGFKTVPLIQICPFNFTLEQLLEMAKGKYESGKHREGIVIRPTVETYSPTIDQRYGMAGRMSFKVLNNDYLEEEE